MDARALAALAANPGCRRRALLDGAGVDKAALAGALGSPAAFGQSQFALARGNSFEARVKADDGADLMRLLYERLGGAAPAPEPGRVAVPDLSAAGPEGRAARTALALREATAAGGWTLLDHPLITLEVAGSPAYLEPDAVVVHPDGGWTVVEIKSFPMIDGSADPAKVGAAARQAAVYALALRRVAAQVLASTGRAVTVRDQVLLVCPKDFANLPTAEAVDIRKQMATTERQLRRLTQVEEIAGQLPPGTSFDLRLADDGRTVTRSAAELTEAVESVDAAYAPECLAACELAFHCRGRARAAGAVESLGRGVRGELGGLRTVEEVLAAARTETEDETAGSVASRDAAPPGTASPGTASPGTASPGTASPGTASPDAASPGTASPVTSPTGTSTTGTTGITGDTDTTSTPSLDAPAVDALRRAAALRAEALACAGRGARGGDRTDGSEGVSPCR
ncbi:hypothetical protein [Streptomyces sp. NPDC059788]|uniref:hypothetical protein n=1 Tax=Streptomyces sp. NPDC059788 TaxID=3346948 RepID=UPI003661D04F